MAGDQGILIAAGSIIVLSVIVLFFQVAGIASRVDDMEGRLHVVEKKTERIEDIFEKLECLDENLKDISLNLKQIKGNISDIHLWMDAQERKNDKLWAEILRVEKEINNVKESANAPIPPLLAQFVTIKLMSGDTLAKISEAFQLGEDGVNVLMELNSIKDPRSLRVGETIRVPACLSEVAVLPFEGKMEKDTVQRGFDESGWVSFRLPEGTVVRASMPGRVVKVKAGYVKVYHGSGVTTSYRWIGEIEVSEGDWVKAGQEIGVVRGGELLFALMVDGEPKDPFRVIFSYRGTFQTSFYTEWDDGILPEQPTFKLTRSGKLVSAWWTIAADPSVLPLGSVVYIPELSDYPGWGIFKVEDTGALVKGYRLDVYVSSIPLAMKLARKEVRVYVYRGD